MKISLISDNVDTLVGMRLVGIRGSVVHEENEVKKVLDELSQDKDIGILLVTYKLAEQFPHLIEPLRIKEGFPIVVEIPDRHGMGDRKDELLKTIRESMGVKI